MKPMLAESVDSKALTELIVSDDWFVQQKLDGDRLLIRVDDGKVTALNRAGEPRRNIVPRKVLDEFRDLPGHWCFDGELLDDLWIFDLPQAMEHVRPDHPLEFRLDLLAVVFSHWNPASCVRLLPTARLRDDKAKLLKSVLARDGEGLMLKNRKGIYRPGARSRQMLKFKLTKTADAVVTAVGVDGRANCHYSMFDGAQLVEVGSCSTQARPTVRTGDVIELKYLYASDDRHLYQPVMLRIRDDKPAEQCTIDQLVYTDRSVIDFRPKRVGPFMRQRRRCRATGATVAIYDTNHPDNAFDPDGGRWVTYCEDHDRLVNHDTLALARAHAADSSQWCGLCAGTEEMES